MGVTRMQAGDLIFVRQKGVIADIITAVDIGEFDHVAIAVNETDIIEAQYNTKVHIIPNPYLNYEVVALHLGNRAKMAEFSKLYLGKKYDFTELVRILVRKELHVNWLDQFNNGKEVICSELAGDYLEYVGIAPKGEELLAPNELYNNVKALGY